MVDKRDLFIDLFKTTDSDIQMLNELKQQLSDELNKPESEQDSKLISELCESITEIVSETEKEKAFAHEKAEQITAPLISSYKKSRITNCIRWLSVAVACVVLVTGLNHYTMTAFGAPLHSFLYQMTITGIRVNFEQEIIELPTSEDDPYGIKAKCAEYGFCPLTPTYIPEDYKLVEITVNDEFPERTLLRFFYKKFYLNYMQNENVFSVNYELFADREYITPHNIPSQNYNIKEENINGIKVVTLYEDNRFSALFQKGKIVHSIYTQNVDYEECQKILESMS